MDYLTYPLELIYNTAHRAAYLRKRGRTSGRGDCLAFASSYKASPSGASQSAAPQPARGAAHAPASGRPRDSDLVSESATAQTISVKAQTSLISSVLIDDFPFIIN